MLGIFFLDSSNVSVWFSLFFFIELIFIVVLILGLEDICFSSSFYEWGGEVIWFGLEFEVFFLDSLGV